MKKRFTDNLLENNQKIKNFKPKSIPPRHFNILIRTTLGREYWLKNCLKKINSQENCFKISVIISYDYPQLLSPLNTLKTI